jgi:chromosome segregation ATPase
MSDVVTEKLTQKVVNLVEEVTEVNMLIRRLDSTKETLNKINERNDAMHTALVQIEKGLKLDDKRIIALEAQTKSLESLVEDQKEQTKFVAGALEKQRKQIDSLNLAFPSLETRILVMNADMKEHVSKLADGLQKRIETATYRQNKWLIIVGAALLFVLALLALKQ